MKYHVDGSKPANGEVFVFGSNLMGIHGKGAAAEAMLHGAVFGQGIGFQGNSYAIPTKADLKTRLPKEEIRRRVYEFLALARALDRVEFFVTRIGCGYAGYKDAEIAPMFALAPPNCNFAEQWRPYLEDTRV